MILREIRPRRGDVIPRGWRIVDYRDYKNIAVIAPVGIHWVVKAWNWLYEGVEYRWCRALSDDLLLFDRYTRTPMFPFCIEVLGDEVSQRRGYGWCWEWESVQRTGNGWGWKLDTYPAWKTEFSGRVIAPIGLNLVYAFWRWLKFQ